MPAAACNLLGCVCVINQANGDMAPVAIFFAGKTALKSGEKYAVECNQALIDLGWDANSEIPDKT